jgi:XTP/dITP diphosphohydrolase
MPDPADPADADSPDPGPEDASAPVDVPTPDTRLVLIETSDALPALLPPSAYRAMEEVSRILSRDPASHPAVPHLEAAGFRIEEAHPAAASATLGMNLMAATASGEDVLLARGVVAATSDGDVAYLLGPGDDTFDRTLGVEAARADLEVEYVFLVGAPRGLELLRMVEVMAALRHPETGCPWDLDQDHRSLARHLLEETHELLEAIDSGDDAHLAEELGDVLLQVLFHAQVAWDRRAFGIDDVARGLADKLIRRHPHVFGDGDASTAEEVQANWDQLKAAEKSDRTGPFDGVPMALPALMLAEELQRKASRLGFDWAADEDVVAKVREELQEVEAALVTGDGDDVEAELGDLLLAVTAMARRHGVEPEAALRRAAATFRGRFEAVMSRLSSRELDPAEVTSDQWLALWHEVKDAGW